MLRQIALAVLIATAFLSVSDGDSLIFALGALSRQRINLIALWVSLRLLALVLPLLEGKLDSKLIATDEGLTMLACIHPLIATSLQLVRADSGAQLGADRLRIDPDFAAQSRGQHAGDSRLHQRGADRRGVQPGQPAPGVDRGGLRRRGLWRRAAQHARQPNGARV